MSEERFIRITNQDIEAANQLSLHCPICASAVENYPEATELSPVVCGQCGTLYHAVCWATKGGKCAMLGCEHTVSHPFGQRSGPVLVIGAGDIPPDYRANGRQKRLKAEQRRQVERLRRPGMWQRLWRWLLDQIQVG